MSDEEKKQKRLNSTKSLLRAVLAPKAKTGIPLHLLCQEFQETTLSDLNYRQIGYGSVEQFIRDIPDVCTISRAPEGYMVVRGIPTKDDAHVYKLASGQRKSKKKSSGRPRLNLSQVKRRGPSFSTRKKSSPSIQNSNRSFNFLASHSQGLSIQDAARFSIRTNSNKQIFFNSDLPPRFQRGVGLKPPRLNNNSRFTPSPLFRNTLSQSSAFGSKNLFFQNQPKTFVFNPKTIPPSTPITPTITRTITNQSANENTKHKKQPVTTNRDKQTSPVTIKVQWSPQEIAGFRDKLKKFLSKYQNGLILSRLTAEYKRVHSKQLPENFNELLVNHYSDIVDIDSTKPKFEIVYLKKSVIEEMANEKERKRSREEKLSVTSHSNMNGNSSLKEEKSAIAANEKFSFLEGEIPFINLQDITEETPVIVCHVDSPSRFFIQIAANYQMLNDLCEDMVEFYQRNSNHKEFLLDKPSVGDYCSAKYSVDNTWYRAKILSAKEQINVVNDSYRCNVLYVDYGNMEFVVSNELKRLHIDYGFLPMQAIQCELHDIIPNNEDGVWPENVIENFRHVTDTNELYVKIFEKKDSMLSVDIVDGNQRSLIDYLLHNKSACKINTTNMSGSSSVISIHSSSSSGSLQDETTSQVSALYESISLCDENVQVSWVEVPKDEYNDVFVVHVSSSQEVSIILIGQDYSEKLDVLEDTMNRYYDELKTEPIKNIEIGDFYVAFSSTSWYRVQLLSIADNECEVLMVDYGKKTSVVFDDIRELLPAFKKLPFQAIRCMLSDVPMSYDPEILQYLTEMTVNKPRVAYFVKRAGDDEKDCLNVIELLQMSETHDDSTININKELKIKIETENDLVPQLPKVGEEALQAYISHISCHGDFYLQIIGAGLQKLQTIMDDMASHFQRPVGSEIISHPEVGMLCCAKYSDNEWYRARVTQVMENRQVEVHFIDYGNSEIVENRNIRKPKVVSEAILTLPVQAIKCKLDGFVEGENCKEELFQQMAYFVETYPVETVWVKQSRTDNGVPVIKLGIKDDCDNEIDFVDKFYEVLSQQKDMDYNNITPFENISVVNDIEQTQETASFSEWDVINTTNVSTSKNVRLESPLTVLCTDSTIPQMEFNSQSIQSVVQDATDPFKFSITPIHLWDRLKDLHMMMATYYKDSTHCVDFLPSEKSICVAFRESDGIWYRAVVQSIIEEDEMCLVKFPDFSSTIEIVNLKNIRPMAEMFKKLPFFSIQCKLGDIELNCNSDEKTSKMAEFFQNITINVTFIVEILCDIHNIDRNKRLPVKLYGQMEKGKAYSVSRVLIKQGYAKKR